MRRSPRRAAAWAVLAARATDDAPAKRTHKLPPMQCVLWVPAFGAYLKTFNQHAREGVKVTVSKTPDSAMQLDDEAAEKLGQEVAKALGRSVHLRPAAKH